MVITPAVSQRLLKIMSCCNYFTNGINGNMSLENVSVVLSQKSVLGWYYKLTSFNAVLAHFHW